MIGIGTDFANLSGERSYSLSYYTKERTMKNNTKIYNRFKGFTLEDCDCRYCLYYGGRRKGNVNCLADECVCADEIRQAKERYRRERSI